jgi:hypothetical protein
MDLNYVTNCSVKAPGLAIGTDTTTALYANTYQCKVNGIISAPTATADLPALSTSLGRAGVASTVLATKMCRFYTVLAAVSKTTSAITFTLVHGDDFSLITDIGRVKYINGGNTPDDVSNKAIVGYFCVLNGTASDFTPGTTDLAASGVTTLYVDQWGYVGM